MKSNGLQSGSFVSALCLPGSSLEAGRDLLQTPCSTTVGSDKFVVSLCVQGSIEATGSNLITSDCSNLPEERGLFTIPCESGSTSSVGVDASYKACSEPISGQFVSKTCTSDLDTEFKECSLLTAPDGSFVSSLCEGGNSQSVGNDMIIEKCKEQPPFGSFVTDFCKPGSEISLGSDLQHSKCSNIKGAKIKCRPGSSLTLGSDAYSTDCAKPSDNEYVAEICTPDNDTVVKIFTDISIESGYYLIHGEAGSPGRTGTDNTVKEWYERDYKRPQRVVEMQLLFSRLFFSP